MKEYWNPDWKQTLNTMGLNDFASVWNLNIDPIEPPNTYRGGESYVMKLNIPNAKQSIYIKKQDNHLRRTFQHPFKGIPTTAIEFKYLSLYQKYDVPSLTPIYWGQGSQQDADKGLLITLGLDDFVDLTVFYQQLSLIHEREAKIIHENLIKETAIVLQHLHKAKIQHSALYPKHILVKNNGHNIEVRIIDLEKSRRRPIRYLCQRRDIECLFRYASFWNQDDQRRFLSHYLNTQDSNKIASFHKKLQKRTIKKLAK